MIDANPVRSTYEKLRELLFTRNFRKLEQLLSETNWDREHEEPLASLMWFACGAENSADLVEWLLANGFKSNVNAIARAIAGDNNPSIFPLLLKNLSETKINYKNPLGENFVMDAVGDALSRNTSLWDEAEKDKQAMIGRTCSILESLLTFGVRVNEPDNTGDLALHRCAINAYPHYSAAHIAFSRVLINCSGASPCVFLFDRWLSFCHIGCRLVEQTRFL